MMCSLYEKKITQNLLAEFKWKTLTGLVFFSKKKIHKLIKTNLCPKLETYTN